MVSVVAAGAAAALLVGAVTLSNPGMDDNYNLKCEIKIHVLIVKWQYSSHVFSHLHIRKMQELYHMYIQYNLNHSRGLKITTYLQDFVIFNFFVNKNFIKRNIELLLGIHKCFLISIMIHNKHHFIISMIAIKVFYYLMLLLATRKQIYVMSTI